MVAGHSPTTDLPLGAPNVPAAHCPKHQELKLVLLQAAGQVPLGSAMGGAPGQTVQATTSHKNADNSVHACV